MTAKVTHFEIIGKDGKKLQEFYGKLFDWNVDAGRRQRRLAETAFLPARR